MTLRWQPCEFTQDGIRFRVREGVKRSRSGDHVDHVMEWLTPTGWVPVRFLTVGLMFDFLYWNENGLYPPPAWKGGNKLLDYLRHAAQHDIHQAERGLQAEKAAAAARRNGGAA